MREQQITFPRIRSKMVLNENLIRKAKGRCDAFGGELILDKEVCLVDGFPLWILDHRFEFKENQQEFIVVDPSKFADVAPLPEDEYRGSVLRSLKGAIKEKEPIEFAHFNVDINRCKVTAHEGRHRALAAARAGVGRFPVVVWKTEPLPRDATLTEELASEERRKKPLACRGVLLPQSSDGEPLRYEGSGPRDI